MSCNSNSKFNIKSVYGDEIRKYEVSYSVAGGYDGIKQQIGKVHDINVNDLVLKYKDEDGDIVTIGHVSNELQCFLNNYASNGKVGRLIVSKKGDSKHVDKNNTTTASSTQTRNSASTGSETSSKVDQPTVVASIGNTTLEVRLSSVYHPHELVYIKSPYGKNGFICDACSFTYPSTDYSYHCIQDGFDLCSKCARVQLPKVDSNAGASSGNKTKKQEQQPNKLYDVMLPLVHSILNDDKLKHALPAALILGIDTFLGGQSVSVVINSIVNSSDDIKNNKAVQELLVNHLPQYITVLDSLATNIRPLIQSIAKPGAIELVKSLLPVFLPVVLQQLDNELVKILIKHQDGGNNVDDWSNLAGIFSSQFPFLAGLPLNGLFNQIQQQMQQQQSQTSINNTTSSTSSQQQDDTIWRDLFSAACGNDDHHSLSHSHHGHVKRGRHFAVICDGCAKSNFKGLRHKCNDCDNYDLCDDCIVKAQHIHNKTHTFNVVEPRDKHAWRKHGRPDRHGHGIFGPRVDDVFSDGFWNTGRGCHRNGYWRDRFNNSQEQSSNNNTTTRPSNLVRFISDVNLPDRSEVDANQTLIKTWRVTNDSSEQWPEGSKLIFIRGDRELSYAEEYSVPLAKPNEQVELNAVLVTPNKTGRYTSYYKLANKDRVIFKDSPSLWVDLLVVKQEDNKQNNTEQQQQVQQQQQITATRPSEQQSAESDSVIVDNKVEEQLASEAVQSTTDQQPVTQANSSELTNSTVSSASSVSNPKKSWDVVIESESEDEHKEDEGFVHVGSSGSSDSNTTAPVVQDPVETQPEQQQQQQEEEYTSNEDGSIGGNNNSNGPVDYTRQLELLHELGFNNDVLSLFLLKQNAGDLQKTVTWLIEKLQ